MNSLVYYNMIISLAIVDLYHKPPKYTCYPNKCGPSFSYL